ncbi:MAG: hydroxymethylglutaryl-CoA reductase, degradative [Candidatus Methanomethylicus sp.]|nr:hydroxymethylglutaryl-CoA reductase, degradative [Candidatus Methanomethylicus sp.]
MGYCNATKDGGNLKSSEISGFYKLGINERRKIVKDFSELTDEEEWLLSSPSDSLAPDKADRMIENVIGVLPLPLGIATNFKINGKDYLIPMAIEEASVIAAASHAAKMARLKGGFHTSSTEPIMIGQIQCVNVKDPLLAMNAILQLKAALLKRANEFDPLLVSAGGGAKDLRVRIIETKRGKMLVVELLVDCRDAMGANAVNTMVEAVAPEIARITKGRVILRIISNLATERLARAWVIIDKNSVGGELIVDNIVEASAFAAADPYRAATHNKGILNGVIAVVTATCNDHRAVEAGAHAYASRNGSYSSLSSWEKNSEGDLVGSIEMPMAVGTIGGLTKVHPIARIALKIIGAKSARELGEVIAAVGLAQNLAALRALADEGIQRGHMSLHARNVAIMAGASGNMVDEVAEIMAKENKVRMDRAKELIQEHNNPEKQ